MVQYDPLACLPSAEELPDSDDTPVDNEFQNLIPNLLEKLRAQGIDPSKFLTDVDSGAADGPKV